MTSVTLEQVNENILNLNKKIEDLFEIIEESNLELTEEVKAELTERRKTPKTEFISQADVEKKFL